MPEAGAEPQRTAEPSSVEGGGAAESAGSASQASLAESAGSASQASLAESAGSAPQASLELARAVLEAARVRRESRPSSQRRAGAAGGGRRLRGYSGAGPDPRDPAPLRELMTRLVKARGWQRPAAEARIFGTWEQLVGLDVAAHSRPVKLEDGELTIEAESTAWATQLRGLAGPVLARIGAELGRGVVRRLHVHGPLAPSWRRGPKRVRGRGPRDTYG